jgi:hypothetical protein
MAVSSHPDFLCVPHRIEYDFTTQTGTLYIDFPNSADQTGTIRVFTQIDKDVKLIHVFVGEKADITYGLEPSGKWEAKDHRR